MSAPPGTAIWPRRSSLNVYDKIKTTIDFIGLLVGLNDVMGAVNGLSEIDLKGHGAVDKKINFQDAAESLAMNAPRAIGVGLHNWVPGYIETRKSTRPTGFLIYMPMFSAGAGVTKSIASGAKIRFGNEKIPIKLVF